jgi:hypothetical protein
VTLIDLAILLAAATIVIAALAGFVIVSLVIDDRQMRKRLENLEDAGLLRRIDRPKFQGHIVDADLPESDRAREAQRYADEGDA